MNGKAKNISGVRQSIAHGFDCGHCTMNAATLVNNALVFKNRHNGEIHANAVDLNWLIRFYVQTASTPALKNLHHLVIQALENVVVSETQSGAI